MTLKEEYTIMRYTFFLGFAIGLLAYHVNAMNPVQRDNNKPVRQHEIDTQSLRHSAMPTPIRSSHPINAGRYKHLRCIEIEQVFRPFCLSTLLSFTSY